MCEAIEQIARPAIACGTVFPHAIHKTRPLRLAAANGHKRYEQEAPERIRAWKGHDWDSLDRLYQKGMIDNPVGNAKTVVLTVEGLSESERLFRKLFERSCSSSVAAPTPCDSPSCRRL
jgi:hypothetical protein